MKVLFSEQIPKDFEFPDDNEDAIESAPENSKIVISDGASESFDSKTWAHLLASTLIKRSDLSEDWLTSVIAEYAEHFNYDSLSWSKQAAFSRGSFATLLSIQQQKEHNLIEVFSIGDSLAVFLDGEEFIESYPYIRAMEFQQRPELLSTRSILNNFFKSPDFLPNHSKTWNIQDKTAPILLCMTDALGEWALRHEEEGNPVWHILCNLESLTEFQQLVVQERSDKQMRVDDITLVKLSFTDRGSDELSNT